MAAVVLASCAPVRAAPPGGGSKRAASATGGLARATGLAFVRGRTAELFFPAGTKLITGQELTILVPGAAAPLRALVGAKPATKAPPFPPFGAGTVRYLARLLGLGPPLMPAVGIVSTSRAAAKLSSTASGDLDHDGTVEYLRSCTSAEGVHLTIWSPPGPLLGKRLWSAYYYLGYDTQPSCKPQDYAP